MEEGDTYLLCLPFRGSVVGKLKVPGYEFFTEVKEDKAERGNYWLLKRKASFSSDGNHFTDFYDYKCTTCSQQKFRKYRKV